jgi:hypothetical protein
VGTSSAIGSAVTGSVAIEDILWAWKLIRLGAWLGVTGTTFKKMGQIFNFSRTEGL